MSYYAMHRGWMAHPVFDGEKFSERDAWAWLIENAVICEKTISHGGQPVKLARGQLSFSVRYLAEAWDWHRSKVERFFEKLKKWEMIETASETGQQVITICNYSKYQDNRENTETAARQGFQDNLKKAEKFETQTETAINEINVCNDLKNKQERDSSETTNETRARHERDTSETNTKNLNKSKKIITDVISKSKLPRPDDVSEEVWADFLRHRQAKKAPVTATAIKRIRSEAEKAGWPIEAALSEMCARGWQGLKAEWIEGKQPQAVAAPPTEALVADQPWKAILLRSLGDAVYRSWIAPLRLENGTLHCPTRFVRDWILTNYGGEIRDAIGRDFKIAVVERQAG